MRNQALHLDVAQRRCGQQSTGEFERIGKRLFILLFVNRGAAHHAFERYLRTERRNENGVAIFKARHIAFYAVQQQVVDIDVLHDLIPAEMFDDAQRSARRRAARGEQRIQRRGERTDVIRSGLRHIAYYVHADGAQARQRDIDIDITKLCAQVFLHRLLHVCQRFSRDQFRPDFGQGDAAFAIHHFIESPRNSAPKVDGNRIARSQHVVGTDRHIHWDRLQVARAILKNLHTEALQRGRMRSGLQVHVEKRRNVVVRIWRVNDSRVQARLSKPQRAFRRGIVVQIVGRRTGIIPIRPRRKGIWRRISSAGR